MYTYDDTQTIRLSEIKLMSLEDLKQILAQVDSPTQAREMAAHHSPEASAWVDSVIVACNSIHKELA